MMSTRYAVRVGLLGVAGLVAAVAAISVGTQVSPATTLATLLSGDADGLAGTIVFNVRLPRVLVGLVAGASLGVSGLLLQVALRNPLAAPEVVGVSSGAVLGVVAALSFGLVEGTAPAGIIAAASLGGLTAAALLWLVAGGDRAQPAELAVLGVVVAAALAGATALLITLDPASLGGAVRWLIGSLNGRVWPHWVLLWPWALLWIAVAWALAAVSTVLLTGDALASSLGIRPSRARILLVGVAVALAAGAIAVVGAVAFVGLLVPHVAWVLAGADLRRTVPMAVLGGAVTLAAADALAQAATRYGPGLGTGGEFALPVGAVTAFGGGLMLIALASRSHLAAETGRITAGPRRSGFAALARRRAGPPPDDEAPALVFEDVSIGFDGRAVLSRVDLRIGIGELVVLAGVNGCGKSTMLRLAGGSLRADAGRVLLRGRDISGYRPREVARQLAVLHQHAPAVPGLTVRQLVRQGRYPHRGPIGMLRGGEDQICADAMAEVGVLDYADREVDTLSGGERQRVRLALALAQETPILLLDEPTTHLDIRHQLEMLELVARVHAIRGLTVVMVLHDLTQAARYAHRLVVVHEGGIAADGAPAEVVTPRLLSEVFGVQARLVPDGDRALLAFDRPVGNIAAESAVGS
ncbi:MAG: iron chelate uptake ABC transporter family permease subunit [Pseudonocardia sp.]